jgi:hypothetical protein
MDDKELKLMGEAGKVDMDSSLVIEIFCGTKLCCY